MFKSITYLRCDYDKASNKYTYYYHLIDSEFECEVSASASASASALASVAPESSAAIAEYHKRNLPLISNLYLLNTYILREWHSYWSFEELLDYQKQYMDEYYPIPEINFSKEIYPKLLKMHEELSVFK